MNHNPITFRVSRLARDWPGTWVSEAQLTNFANGYIKHCFKYLHRVGYSDVNVVFCSGYTQLGQFDWNHDPERDLRNAIMADYLNPSKPKTHDLSYLYACDSPKG